MASNVKAGRPALALVSLIVLLSADHATAQPTQAQQSALRSNCRSDFMSNCSGVKPGGIEALQCLQRNVAKLSPGCQSAVHAISPPSAPKQAAPAPAAAPPAAPAPAAAAAPPPAASPVAPAPAQTTAVPPAAPAAPPHQPARPPKPSPAAAAPASAPAKPTAQQQAAIKQSCQSDFMARCRGVKPGGADALHCLQRNAAHLSPNCHSAVTALGGATATRPTTAAPAASTAAAKPTAQQQAAIKQSCQSDFMARCRGVQPGGVEALQCLQRNSTQLSPNCRSAVAALGGGGAAAATPAAAPAATPTPAQQSAVRFTCRRDFTVHCRGVPQGGPEALTCLQSNAARLSPDCRTALAAIAEDAPTAAPAAGPPPGRPVGPLRRAIRDRMMNQ
jgi:hypothetical protein